MKNYFTAILFLMIVLASCTHDTKQVESIKVPFLGEWTRSFDLAPDSIQHVYYRIWQDSIQYEMKGPLPVKYTLTKDSLVENKNKWIGKLNDVTYVIFAKNIGEDSISLFKKQVKDISEALHIKIPSDTVSSHFSSWHVYYKLK